MLWDPVAIPQGSPPLGLPAIQLLSVPLLPLHHGSMSDVPWHLWHRPDGKYQEMRLVHNPGDRVRVIAGRFKGQTVTITHRDGQAHDDEGRLTENVGYGVETDDARFAVIAWDAVEGHPTPETAWWLK